MFDLDLYEDYICPICKECHERCICGAEKEPLDNCSSQDKETLYLNH